MRRSLLFMLVAVLALSVGFGGSAFADSDPGVTASAKKGKKGKKKNCKAAKKGKKGKKRSARNKKRSARNSALASARSKKGKKGKKGKRQKSRPCRGKGKKKGKGFANGTYEDPRSKVTVAIRNGGKRVQVKFPATGCAAAIPLTFDSGPTAAKVTGSVLSAMGKMSLFNGHGDLSWKITMTKARRYTLTVDSSHHFPEQQACTGPPDKIQGTLK